MDTNLSYYVSRQDMEGVDKLIDMVMDRPTIATHQDFYPTGGVNSPHGYGVRKGEAPKRVYSGMPVHNLNLPNG